MKKVLLAAAILPLCLFAQTRKEKKAMEAQQKADFVVTDHLKKHVENLTNPGEVNETASLEYISNEFKAIGLQPKGSTGFVETYLVDEGRKIDPSTFLKINGKLLEVNKEYFPLIFSAEKSVAGRPAMALRERGVPWFLDVKQWLEGDTKIDQENLQEAIKKEIVRVASKGATALFIYNSASASDKISFDGKEKANASPLPVIYITQDGYKKYFNDHSEMLDIELNVAFKDVIITGSNVVGYINNSAPSSVVITTSYFARNVNNPNTLSQKPNDNSVVNSNSIALLIELAKILSASKAKNNNYVFTVFGGAHAGISGSKYWLQNSLATQPFNYVINLDIPGGAPEKNSIIVQGLQTSPAWVDALPALLDKKSLISIDSVFKPSDSYAVFYNRGLPEILFTSRQKNPIALTEQIKVNYTSELQLVKTINKVVETIDTKGKLTFSKIPEQRAPAANVVQQSNVVSTLPITVADMASSVSLGVIPDKGGSSAGLKIIGVSQKKLAAKLGLQAGDILLELGQHKIADMKTYMEALSNFRLGDKTILRIKRGKDDKEFAVEF